MSSTDKLLDNKTCTFRFTKDGRESAEWVRVKQMIRGYEPLDAEWFQKWIAHDFSRRTITYSANQPPFSKEQIERLKSPFIFLQLGCIVTDGESVGLYERLTTGPDGTARLTDGFSIIRSWSPKIIDPDIIKQDLIARIPLRDGYTIECSPYAIAFTELRDESHPPKVKPAYLFLLFTARTHSDALMTGERRADDKKKPDICHGFFKIDDIKRRQVELFEQPLSFQGLVDELAVDSINGVGPTFPHERAGLNLQFLPPNAGLSFNEHKRGFTEFAADWYQRFKGWLHIAKESKESFDDLRDLFGDFLPSE